MGTGGSAADQTPTLTPSEAQSIEPIPDVRNYPPANPGNAPKVQTRKVEPAPGQPIPLTDPQPPVTPVPDLDAATDRKQVPAAPSLFDPRDRTASLGVRQALAVSPIIWPDSTNVVEARTVTAEISIRPEEQVETLESDGWRAVRP